MDWWGRFAFWWACGVRRMSESSKYSIRLVFGFLRVTWFRSFFVGELHIPFLVPMICIFLVRLFLLPRVRIFVFYKRSCGFFIFPRSLFLTPGPLTGFVLVSIFCGCWLASFESLSESYDGSALLIRALPMLRISTLARSCFDCATSDAANLLQLLRKLRLACLRCFTCWWGSES